MRGLVMQAVILAAGKGTRLGSLTHNRSKAMMPVAGKPMIERAMETFFANGVSDFIIVVSDEDTEITRYFNQESTLNAKITFVKQTERLGMANALSEAASSIREAFIVSACDNIVHVDHIAALIATFNTYNANAVLSLKVVEQERISSTGIVDWQDGEIHQIVEKPLPEEAPSNISSLPLYIFSPKILSLLPTVPLSPRGEYELQDAIQTLINRERGVRGVLTEWRIQLTNADDLLALNRHYLKLSTEVHIAPHSIGNRSHLIMPLRMDEGTSIGQNCRIGPNVYIEAGCQIGADAVIEDAVLFRDSVIEAGQTVMGAVFSS